MRNPYKYHGLSLIAPSRRVIEITPSSSELDTVVKSLRIYNPEDTEQTVTYLPVGQTEEVTITVLPKSIWIENVVVSKVTATSSPSVEIHGYSD